MNILSALRQRILAGFRIGKLRLGLRSISVGKNFYCNKGFFISRKAKFKAGDNVYIGRHAHIANNLVIGNDVMVASCASFVGGDHRIDNIGTTPIRYTGREHDKTTIIEDNVWIGHGCIILAGVTIKSGAVTAAGAVVTRDVDHDEIVGGTPAKVIRKRIV